MNRPSQILIVDDSPEDCEMYRRQLERSGDESFALRVAHSAAKGLQECRAQIPACVLLDFNLPDSDGLDFLTELRAELGEQMPPVVMLTGQGNESVAVQAMKLGAQDYLVKGLKGDDLRHSIQNAIEHVALRRQVEQHQLEVARLSAERAQLIEELERHAVALSEADRRENEFLAVLAHELRNPLGPIRNAAQLIRLDGGCQTPEAPEIIERQVSHMARLIDDLLDVSRIVRGKITLHNEHLHFNSLVTTVVEDHRAEFDAAGVTLIDHVPDAEIWFQGDATRLRQVLSNILDNARKFTPAGGVVKVLLAANHPAATLTLTVSDSGEGLDSGTLGRMFEVFSQADRSLDRSRGGLGLGLAIVKGITELHGGTVVARSDGPGCGCEIALTLPRAAVSPDPSEERAASHVDGAVPQVGGAAAKLRILVVEDNRDAGDSLHMLLAKLGHKAVVARTGQSALETAQGFRPELVICDIGLSDEMSGYVVAERFRAHPSLASTYLVALTGYGQVEDQRRAQDAGFDLHLIKPIAIETLLELPAKVKHKAQVSASDP